MSTITTKDGTEIYINAELLAFLESFPETARRGNRMAAASTIR